MVRMGEMGFAVSQRSQMNVTFRRNYCVGRLRVPPGSRRHGVYRGWVRNIEPDRARAAMAASYQAVTDDVGKLDQDELARPCGCRGWSRGDLLFHMLLDAQRALHHLDLMAGDDSLAGPSGPGLTVARETLDGALGEPVPVGWDDVDYVLKATGRAELTDGDRASLGVLAARFPLLG
jgi:Mycothiol maleylpyruvate isomerase N-terminal domain